LTKLEGEKIALQTNPSTVVLRTSWVYAFHGRNFLNTMLRLGAERDSLNIVYDQIGAPTSCKELVSVCKRILDHIDNGNDLKGIFNFSNRGVTSWYDYALEIFRLANINCNVRPILSEDFPTPAARPTYSVLNTNKIESELNINIPHWRSSLEETMKEERG
jgi:dTDP-4-dehydrorhamnose reductase